MTNIFKQKMKVAEKQAKIDATSIAEKLSAMNVQLATSKSGTHVFDGCRTNMITGSRMYNDYYVHTGKYNCRKSPKISIASGAFRQDAKDFTVYYEVNIQRMKNTPDTIFQLPTMDAAITMLISVYMKG